MKRIYFEALTFVRFAKEAVVIARVEQLIEEQFAHTKTTKNVKKIRINQGRRFVQKREIISMKKCRKMIYIK